MKGGDTLSLFPAWPDARYESREVDEIRLRLLQLRQRLSFTLRNSQESLRLKEDLERLSHVVGVLLEEEGEIRKWHDAL